MDGGFGLSRDVLERTPAEVLELLARMAVRLEAAEARVKELEAQVAELREQLGKDSTNSSFPSSSDRPGSEGKKRKRKPPTKPSGRARGGQRGHERNVRSLVDPDRVDEVVDCKPTECERCGETLAADDPDPTRHQVADIPPIEPHVVEYRIHRIDCPCCGAGNCGRLPDGVPRGAFGPRLCALVALLVSVRLAKRPIQQLLADLFSLDISLGMISKIERRTAGLLRDPYKRLWRLIRGGDVNIDETGWRQDKKKCWLWAAATRWAVVFKIAKRRNAQVAKRILGAAFGRVATSDRHGAYTWLRRRQLCWAHLARDFQAMIDREDEGSAIGKLLLSHADVMFGWYRNVRDGTWKLETFRRNLRNLQHAFRADLEEGRDCSAAKTSRVCDALLKSWEHLWTFASVEGVEPTNNEGERVIKVAVQYRKTSGGTDSRIGSRFLERLFSVVATCRRQRRNVFHYLTDVWTAHLHRRPIPNLETARQTIAQAA